MPFDFACAKPLYRRGVHPRLLLGPDDLDRLRSRTRRGPGAAILGALRRKAAAYVDSIHASREWVDLLKSGSFFWPKPRESFLWALPDLALVGRLDRDARAIDAVRQVFAELTAIEPSPRSGGFVAKDYYIAPTHIPCAYDLIAPEFDASARQRFASWAVAAYVRDPLARLHPRYLKSPAHNMSLGGMVIALTTLLAVEGDPGVPGLQDERAELLRWFEASLYTALGPEGYPEEDIGYGTVVAPALVQLAEALSRAGVFNAFAQVPRLARFGNAMLHFVQPWGETLANTGDHGTQLRDRQFSLARLASRNDEPALRWLAGTLTYTHSRTFPSDPLPLFDAECQPSPGVSTPASWLSLAALDDMAGARTPKSAGVPTAYCDSGRGLVSFRSGWGADDTLLIFDGSQRSPAAPGHYHDSGGHFSLSAMGEHFAIDTGRYNLEQNCHNVVLVEGKSGRSTGGEWSNNSFPTRLTGYAPGSFVDFASADSSHQHNCFWAWRSVGLVKGGGAPAYAWVVDDINKNSDWGGYWWQLHTSPENHILIEGDKATITGWRRGRKLDAHFILPAPETYPRPHRLTLEQDVATPSSSNYVRDLRQTASHFTRPAATLHGSVLHRPRLLAKVEGYNGRFMSLLLPRGHDGAPAKVEQLPTLINALAVRITFADVEDTVIWAYEHHLLEAGEVQARGNWCVVRRERRSGRVTKAAGGDLTSLRVAGKSVRLKTR